MSPNILSVPRSFDANRLTVRFLHEKFGKAMTPRTPMQPELGLKR
jgi:hypothetical protein